MAETLRLRLVTPERMLLDEDIDEVIAPGTAGEFGVLPNHITFLSSIEAGRLAYKQGGRTQTVAVSGGFAEVVNNEVTVLADNAQFANEIDVEQARTALREAEERLRTLGTADPDFAPVEATRRWEQARLDAAREARS